MKLMRWAMCVAAFAVMGEVAKSEDYVDISAMQAKLAAQEARLNDLQAKVYGGGACGEEEKVIADGLTSLRKNATVTLGGLVTTRYRHINAKVESSAYDADGVRNGNAATSNNRQKVIDIRHGYIETADAKLEGKIDVNEYFDAYFKFAMHNGARSTTSSAQTYWVRWKNICNSGFGILVGRDAIKFGQMNPYGHWDSWSMGQGDFGNLWGSYSSKDGSARNPMNGFHTGMAINRGMSARNALDCDSRTVQVTPYWENKDGSFKIEASFFQSQEYDVAGGLVEYGYDDAARYYRRMNDGVGSMSGRITWKPIEGLKLSGSVINIVARKRDSSIIFLMPGAFGPSGSKVDNNSYGYDLSSNNFATNLAFEYRPAFFNRLNLFASWTHSWNDSWIKDQDSDSVSFGFGFDITSALTFYAKGEHVSTKSDQARGFAGALNGGEVHKLNAWANELGLIYTFPYGVKLSGGWRHEDIRYKNSRGVTHTKAKADGFYSSLSFAF